MLACASSRHGQTINGREGAEYFGREALLDYAKTPFKVTDTMDHFDVIARINGGGISVRPAALRHGISRALLDAGDYRAELKKAGYLTPRLSWSSVKVRPEEVRLQASAVLEALVSSGTYTIAKPRHSSEQRGFFFTSAECGLMLGKGFEGTPIVNGGCKVSLEAH